MTEPLEPLNRTTKIAMIGVPLVAFLGVVAAAIKLDGMRSKRER